MDVRSFVRSRRTRVGRRVRARIPVEKTLKKSTRRAVTKIAQRAVKRAIETKYVAAPVFPEGPVEIWATSQAAGGQPQLFDVFPGLLEGTGEFERTGTKVNPISHTVDVNLRFNNKRNDITGASPLDSCAWDITAHVWYGFARRYKNENDAQANAATLLGQLLEDGAGNVRSWDGAPYDDFYKVNKEIFDLKHKAVRMYRPFGDQNAATLAGGLTTYFPQKIEAKMRLSFKPPKTLLFDELQGIPQNYAPIVIVAYKHNDGTQGATQQADGPNILNKPALMLEMYSHMYFKDA